MVPSISFLFCLQASTNANFPSLKVQVEFKMKKGAPNDDN
jgi:hypothetical protein